jgi:hypothetical protein
MLAIVKHGVDCFLTPHRVSRSLASIRIQIEVRKIAARNIHADTVALREAIPRGDQVNSHFSNFAGLQRNRFIEALAPTHANNSVLYIHRESERVILRRWRNVDQLGREIRVRS